MPERVALITGSASGIGRAIAIAFAQEGYAVVVADVNDKAGDSVVQEIQKAGSGAAAYVHLDVTSEKEWIDAVQFTVKTFGKLTTLIGNAGIAGPVRPVEEMGLDEYKTVVDVTSTSVFLGAKHASAELQKHPGVASVVNIASVMSLVSMDPPHFMGYAAAKGACQSISRNLAVAWATKGVRVNSVHPGFINTPILSVMDAKSLQAIKDKHAMKRLGEPEEIANAVVFLASAKASFITGASIVVDGGYTAL